MVAVVEAAHLAAGRLNVCLRMLQEFKSSSLEDADGSQAAAVRGCGEGLVMTLVWGQARRGGQGGRGSCGE